jgi:hypothetical protein
MKRMPEGILTAKLCKMDLYVTLLISQNSLPASSAADVIIPLARYAPGVPLTVSSSGWIKTACVFRLTGIRSGNLNRDPSAVKLFCVFFRKECRRHMEIFREFFIRCGAGDSDEF